jgi:hypothetical protein
MDRRRQARRPRDTRPPRPANSQARGRGHELRAADDHVPRRPRLAAQHRRRSLPPLPRRPRAPQLQSSSYRGDGELVFGHPILGTPLDPSKLSRVYMRPALAKAMINKPFRPGTTSGTPP